ncbi:mechanosensitive ion channel family protein [Mitsuaria sp. 7]|uniref:mechanosensitive ion channel family protein n=1 Tax=Mitsuaria sp. 7 TaxID=1658665 RepID=UPI001E394C87|nr:mechanosensitive ion channel domain-containing protein [Mitsuaria sp. 7]
MGTTSSLNHTLSLRELESLLTMLARPQALIEFGLVLACLALSWLIVYRISKHVTAAPGHHSVLLGHRVFDGVLFPVIALLLALGARRVMPLLGEPVALFRVVIPVLLSLVVIRLVARVLRATMPDSVGIKLLERSVSWIAWLGSILWIIGVLPILIDELQDADLTFLPKNGKAYITVYDVLLGVLQVGAVLLVVLWLSSVIESRLLRGKSVLDLSMRKIAVNLTRTALLVVGTMVALNTVGLNLSALSWLGGAVGVGLGFGLQKIAANYVSGFMILAERSLRIGDMVKVDNFEGRISDIKTRYTVIRALNGREAIVPNESLITTRVENLSLADPQVNVSTVVQVAYGTDVDALFPQLIEEVKRVPRVLSEPSPSVALSNFAADGLELTIGFWISDPHNGQGGVRSDVNLAILRLLNRLEIDIPFPQRVLRTVVEGPVAPVVPAEK